MRGVAMVYIYLWIFIFGAISILRWRNGLTVDSGRSKWTLWCETTRCWHWLCIDAIRFRWLLMDVVSTGRRHRTLLTIWIFLLWHSWWCVRYNVFAIVAHWWFGTNASDWPFVTRSIGHIARWTQSFQIWWTVWRLWWFQWSFDFTLNDQTNETLMVGEQKNGWIVSSVLGIDAIYLERERNKICGFK